MDHPSTRADFIISPSNRKVIYIHSSLFRNMPNMVKFVGMLHRKNCGTDLRNLCQQEPCNTTLAIYLDTDDSTRISPETIERELYKNILGFLTAELYDNYAEIYNICTSKKYRGKGVMKSILTSLLTEIPKQYVWLGINIHNPMKYHVLRLYLSVGFNMAGIQNITPTNSFPGFPFISMLYHKGQDVDRPVDLVERLGEKVVQIINQYENTGGKCHIKTHINPELINDINELYITKNVEYGGILGAKKVGHNNYLLGLAARTKGDEKTLTVAVPPYYINWHTHPFICYEHELCYIGWPSGLDMSLIINKYSDGVLAHVLFANEGIYFMQLSPEMMAFLRVLPRLCINDLAKVVRYFFTKLEHYRNIEHDPERIHCLDETEDPKCLRYDSKQKHLSIEKIIGIIRKTEMFDLLQTLISEDDIKPTIIRARECLDLAAKRLKTSRRFQIFRIHFTPMDQALKQGVTTQIQYLTAPNSPACPVPNYEGKDINFGGERESMNLASEKDLLRREDKWKSLMEKLEGDNIEIQPRGISDQWRSGVGM